MTSGRYKKTDTVIESHFLVRCSSLFNDNFFLFFSPLCAFSALSLFFFFVSSRRAARRTDSEKIKINGQWPSRYGWLQPARCSWLGACAAQSSCKSRRTIGTGTACGVTSRSSSVSRCSSSCCPASWPPLAFRLSTPEGLTNISWVLSVCVIMCTVFSSLIVIETFRNLNHCRNGSKLQVFEELAIHATASTVEFAQQVKRTFENPKLDLGGNLKKQFD